MTITQEQIDKRLNGIGGSDAAVVANCNPYKTKRELYHEKRGELSDVKDETPEAAHWGNVLEDIIAKEYERRSGHKVRRINRTLQHPDLPFVIGHIDRDIVNTDRALECKTASTYLKSEWGEDGTDQVPEHYLIQTQHYMAIMPKIQVFDLAVLIGGQEFRCYHIPRDNGLIDSLLQLEMQFWNDVEYGNAPVFQYDHPSTIELINKLYPGTDGTVIDLESDAVFWHKTLEQAKAKVKEYQGVIDGAKAHLKALCGSAAVGLLPGMDGAGYTRKLIKKKPYTVTPDPYIDFRFSKKPKGV